MRKLLLFVALALVAISAGMLVGAVLLNDSLLFAEGFCCCGVSALLYLGIEWFTDKPIA